MGMRLVVSWVYPVVLTWKWGARVAEWVLSLALRETPQNLPKSPEVVKWLLQRHTNEGLDLLFIPAWPRKLIWRRQGNRVKEIRNLGS
jgi:hypothetical protein